jgi:hypothetical protein
MNHRNEILRCASALVVVALLLFAPIASASDEATKEYLTAEEYVKLAQPYLHLSCEAAWAMAKEDADAYVEIVDKVSAIGFLNHDLDISEVYEHSEAEVEALRIDFYTSTGDFCRENPNLLLAGVVERALLQAFTDIAPEAVDD